MVKEIKRQILHRKIKKILLEIIKKSGTYASEHFNNFDKSSIHYKFGEGRGVVTEVDLYLDSLIKEMVFMHFPEHDFISEESEPINNQDDYVWIVDPIDGTGNYVKGNKEYCISIAVAKGSELLFGAIYAPELDELYFAQKNKGFYLNGKKITEKAPPQDVCYVDRRKTSDEIADKFFPECEETYTGSAALELAHVAHGKVKGAIFEGILMIHEMGGKVTDLEGNPFNFSKPNIVAYSSK